MEVVILPNSNDVAHTVADVIERLLVRKPRAVLGLATGTSPLGTYAELIVRHRAGRLSFAGSRAFLLDEYIGLRHDHPASYHTFIRDHFTGLVDFAVDAVLGPPGEVDPAVDGGIEAACRDYEAAIAASGGVDVQLLGIGTDGHVGFNEPTSSLASRTRVKTLTEQTRLDNSRFFASVDHVPRHVLTQGIGTILEARHLVLVATGTAKAAPIASAVEGPLAAMCPASAIQLHPHASVVIDEAAASRLQLGAYYRATFSAKPSWQDL